MTEVAIQADCVHLINCKTVVMHFTPNFFLQNSTEIPNILGMGHLFIYWFTV